MGKKKHRVSGASSKEVTSAVIIAATVPVGMGLAHEAKSYFIPMLYATTDTEAQKKTKRLYGNLGATAIGVLAVAGGVMVKGKEAEIGSGLVGLGAGILGHCALSFYLNNIKDPAADGTANNRIAGNEWDNKVWQDAKKKALGMRGADNNAAGMAGADNASPGVMGIKLTKPLGTMIDQIGNYFQVGSCAL